MRTQIGTIRNYYGGLYVKEEDGRFFWGIENYDWDQDGTDEGWREISRYLYYTLLEEEYIKG